MSVYVAQAALDFKFKCGWAEEWRVFQRIAELGTSAGPMLHIATNATDDRGEEGRLFADLAAHRVRGGHDRQADYEIFFPAGPVLRYLNSTAFANLGYITHRRPLDPRKETAVQWLRKLEQFASGFAGVAAAHNLMEERRLSERRVSLRQRGGYTLADAIAGRKQWGTRRVGLIRQTSFDFAVTVVDTGVHLVSEVRAGGGTFRFFVFAEAQERDGVAPHPRAVAAGVPWAKPRLRAAPRDWGPIIAKARATGRQGGAQ